MKRLDRFILTSFIGPFFAVLLVVIFVLMMDFLWLYIDELVGKGLGLRTIAEFMGWGCCTLLPMALPLSTLLASMMTLGNLGENNELLAIKSAGVSLSRVLAPLIVVSAIISILAFFAANNLIPIAYENIFTLRDDIGRTKEEIKIPTGTFYNGIDNYILRVDERDDETGMMRGVMVYNHSSNNGNVSLTVADSAMMKISEDKSYLTFSLFNGTNYEETNTRRYRDTTLQLQTIDFRRQSMVIPLENYSFQKSDTSRFSNETKAKELKVLRQDHDSLGHIFDSCLLNNLASMRHNRAFRWSAQLDTSEFPATVPFEDENLGEYDSIQDKLDAYMRARESAAELGTSIDMMSRDVDYYIFILRRVDLEIFKKFALAFACFVFFFIGAPLGSIIRKGGLATSAIISVLFFVFYWVIDTIGTKQAKDGSMTPAMGAFIATAVLLPIGIFLTRKAINDSALFSMDNLKSGARRLKRKIMNVFRKTRIVYMGTPEFAVAPLEALLASGYDVVGVVTVADKQSGRGMKVNESAVKKYAVERGIPVLQPLSLKDPAFLEALAAWKADLFVVVAFRMLPKVVWSMPRLGTFNLHAALLPQYRGAAPINWAVINGDGITGVTTFRIDDGMDTGTIMFREQYRIKEDDSLGDVHDALMEIGSRLVVQTVEAIEDNSVEYRLQKSFVQGSEVLRPAPKITRELCHIDWNDGSARIRNLVRGLSPYPAAFTTLEKDGESTVLKLFRVSMPATMPEGWESAAPGSLLSDSRTFLAVRTADGVLSVDELQLAGKKRMSAEDFLRGFRDICSYGTGKGTSKSVLDNIQG
ncbi:MAG: methionyl-tRNA formyltransferase [Bacteroidales bacterium]|nr:methionyl-tRNA formyltransferase [Bacteroidales bacterium]